MAAELVAAARQVQVLWTAIAGAQESLGGDLVDRAEWQKLYIPASKTLPALKDGGFDMGDGFHTHILVAGADTYDRTASSAASEFERAMTDAIGAWPFSGTTPALSPAAYQAFATARGEKAEVNRKSFRSVLEKQYEAAERME